MRDGDEFGDILDFWISLSLSLSKKCDNLNNNINNGGRRVSGCGMGMGLEGTACGHPTIMPVPRNSPKYHKYYISL